MKKLKKKFLLLFIVPALVIGTLGGLANYLGPSIWVGEDEVPSPDSNIHTSVLPADIPSVSAQGAILLDANTGEVLYGKNPDKKLYPASTTKIMTAIVALEILDELGVGLDAMVEVPQEAVGVEGSSVYLKKGERLSMEELLYGMMLQSGNDSATAIAVCAGGNMQNFIIKMNQKAEQLGCKNTHFTNPSGLYDENHYTTPRELAIISKEALKRNDFRKIVGTKTWDSPLTDRCFANKNKTVYQYEGATGIKIGFTKASGRTLVASAKRNNKELIAVVLNDGNWFNDAYALMDYGFAITENKKMAVGK